MRNVLVGLVMCAMVLSGCATNGQQGVAGSGDTIADKVAVELNATRGEPMASEGADDAKYVSDRLGQVVSKSGYDAAATEPEVDSKTGEIKVGQTYSDGSTLYLVFVPDENGGRGKMFDRYEIER